jgi:hypothetical protein
VAIDDEELASLALAADLDEPVPPDAVALSLVGPSAGPALSAWYMPAVTAAHTSGWCRPVVIGIVVTLLALEALGLCSVFGQVVVG